LTYVNGIPESHRAAYNSDTVLLDLHFFDRLKASATRDMEKELTDRAERIHERILQLRDSL
jgi:hypothetical protein